MTCNGTGAVYQQTKETINIPKGVDSGTNLRMSKKGNFAARGEAGDLLIKINVRKHPYYSREGSDIYSHKYITVTQAILGATVKVETLEGKKDIKIKAGTVHDDTIKIENGGVHKLPPN